MMAPAFFLTVTILLVAGFTLLDTCTFLAPFRALLWHRYAATFAIWTLVLAVDLFGLIYLAMRVLGLKDTGRKLAHVEQELREGSPIAQELAEQLEDA
jgi:hypothetical protein